MATEDYGLSRISATTRQKLALLVEESRGGYALSGKQVEMLYEALNDQSIFFTGPAGTGKSFLLRRIISRLQAKYPGNNEVAITAPTGIAACNIGGRTIHSFAQIGLASKSAEYYIKNLRAQDWKQLKVLIIDEISMLSAELFDKLEAIARGLRGNDKPWGGIQLIV